MGAKDWKLLHAYSEDWSGCAYWSVFTGRPYRKIHCLFVCFFITDNKWAVFISYDMRWSGFATSQNTSYPRHPTSQYTVDLSLPVTWIERMFAILCSSIGTKLTWKISLTQGGVDEKRTGIQKTYKLICNILSVERGLSPPDKRNNINLLRYTLVLVLDRSHHTCTYLLSVCCFISDVCKHVWLWHSFALKLYSSDGFSSRSCQSEQWMCSPIHISPHPIFCLFLRYKTV